MKEFDSAKNSPASAAAATQNAQAFTYDVFFSYRHRPLDEAITQRTFNALESYRLPKAIRARGFDEIRRAFRDTEELPVSRILTETIDAALRSANCLVVVCSTDTPSSEWIDREVGIFIELGRASHIYPLLISGDPELSFPPSLKLVPDIMDRVMDIRVGARTDERRASRPASEQGGSGYGMPGTAGAPGSGSVSAAPDGRQIRSMMAKEETELLKVISGVVGCRHDELLREHQIRRSRRLVTRAAGAAAVFLAVAGISLGLMRLAQNYRDAAALREQASLRILNELTYDLPARLTSVPDAYGRISGLLVQNTEDINAIAQLSRDGERAEFEAAANYEKLATTLGTLEHYDDALRNEEAAIAILSALADAHAEGAVGELASAHNNRGQILASAGRHAEAAEAFREAIALYAGAENPEPAELAVFTANAGANLAANGDFSGAAEQYEKALTLLRGAGETDEAVRAEAGVRTRYGLILYRVGRYAEAEEHLRRAYDLYDGILNQPHALVDPQLFVQTVSALALCLTDEGRFTEADRYYARAISTAMAHASDASSTEEVAQGLYEQLEARRNLATLYNNRGLLLNMQARYGTADTYYRRAAELYRGVSERTEAPADAADYASTMLNVGENAFKAGDYAASREAFEAGLAAYGPVCQALGSFHEAQYDAWLSYFQLIHNRDPHAALEAGLQGYYLQPDAVLVNINLAYACLYSGRYDDCDVLLRRVVSLGAGQIQNLRLDLDAQQRAGMESEHMEAVLQILDEAETEFFTA